VGFDEHHVVIGCERTTRSGCGKRGRHTRAHPGDFLWKYCAGELEGRRRSGRSMASPPRVNGSPRVPRVISGERHDPAIAALGIVAGSSRALAPRVRAGQLTPVEALRYEQVAPR